MPAGPRPGLRRTSAPGDKPIPDARPDLPLSGAAHHDAGVPEAIMLNSEGNVAEGTVQNVFIVRDGQVQTPTTHDGILEGVTRGVMMQICRDLGIECVEKSLQRLDLYIADEMFLTGTGGEVMPVTKIDGRQIGSGEVGAITRRLKEAFHKRTRE